MAYSGHCASWLSHHASLVPMGTESGCMWYCSCANDDTMQEARRAKILSVYIMVDWLS